MSAPQEDREFFRFHETRDPQAMARVFDLTASRLLLLAMHLVGEASQAEDLVQTTFLQAIKDADSYQGSGSVLAWLMGILVHRAKDARRYQLRRREQQAPPSLELAQDRRPSPLDELEGRDTLEQVRKVLDTLPQVYRHVLVLRLVHGLKAVEIAHSLDRSPESVRTQLRRGLKMLRDRLPKSLLLPSAFTVLASETLAGVRSNVVHAAALTTIAATSGTGVSAGTSIANKALLVATAVLGVAAVGYLVWHEPDNGDPPEAQALTGDVGPIADHKSDHDDKFPLAHSSNRTGRHDSATVPRSTLTDQPDAEVLKAGQLISQLEALIKKRASLAEYRARDQVDSHMAKLLRQLRGLPAVANPGMEPSGYSLLAQLEKAATQKEREEVDEQVDAWLRTLWKRTLGSPLVLSGSEHRRLHAVLRAILVTDTVAFHSDTVALHGELSLCELSMFRESVVTASLYRIALHPDVLSAPKLDRGEMASCVRASALIALVVESRDHAFEVVLEQVVSCKTLVGVGVIAMLGRLYYAADRPKRQKLAMALEQRIKDTAGKAVSETLSGDHLRKTWGPVIKQLRR